MGADTAIAVHDAPVIGGADRWTRVLRYGLVAVLAATVVLRFVAVTPMWLDEAQTVAIARRSLPGLLAALRHDGSPPLYYLLLHGWMAVFGTGTIAVRALSGVCSVATLPLVWLVARRFGAGRAVAWTAVLLVATSPFAVRYATEARMYALVGLLVAAALLAYERLWRRGGIGGYVAAALVTAALVTTQYWCLFLVAVLGVGLAVPAIRGHRGATRVLVALVVGCLGFVPWLPSFAYQAAHTGAPWGAPPAPEVAVWTPRAWTGGGFAGAVLALVYYALAALAVFGHRAPGRGIVLRRPARRAPAALLGLALATMLVGSVISAALGSAYASRYSMVALVPFLVAAAAAVSAIPAHRRIAAVAGVCALGFAVAGTYPAHLRSQSGQVAAALAQASPGDVVVFCPDQLGPAVHRLTDRGNQVVYPTLGSPAMVDWVDYKHRNTSADPAQFVRTVLRMAGRHSAVWLVYASGYPTFGDNCARVFYGLTAARGPGRVAVHLHASVAEHERVVVFAPR